MSEVIRKGILLGESCYRMEDGKRVTYRATSKLLKGMNSFAQSRAWKDLSLVKDLSAKAPVDENGYIGWGLHFMRFLQGKGYIGNIDFDPAIHDISPCDYMERRIDLHMSKWLKEKKAELECDEVCKWNMSIVANKVYYMEANEDEVIRVFRAKKNFNYNGLYFSFMADESADKNMDYGYINWLKNNDYIYCYETVDMKNIIPMAF